MAAIAAVLLAFAAHAIHDNILRAIVERVDRCIEETLKLRLVGANDRRVRPREHPATHPHVANGDTRVAIADVQLQPAQAFKIETLKVIHALATDEAGPTVASRVEQRRAADFVPLMD